MSSIRAKAGIWTRRSQRRSRRRTPAAASQFFIVWLCAIGIFFRTPILSGFDLGFGDRADGIIEISILEHWRNVLRGVAAWDTTNYFYPHVATLGYNDGYFLYGLVYSFWRLFADPFHADTLNILTFKSIGFVAAYLLVARALGWGRPAALLVAFLWTIASNISLQAVHAQLQSVALLPVAMLLAIGIVRAELRGAYRTSRCRAVALAALMAAWLMTSYYMAWFTIFSACLYIACWVILSGRWRPAALLKIARDHGVTIAFGLVTFAVAILPFLRLYLPKAQETGGQHYKELLGYLVTPVIDMINVGPDNYVWGWFFRLLRGVFHDLNPDSPRLSERMFGGEHEAGFPVFFALLLITAASRIFFQQRANSGRSVSVELRAFALAMMIGWLLTLQLWLASPWGVVFELVPGAKGLRVVSRYQLWLALPFLLLVVAYWREHAERLVRSRPTLLAAIVAVLIVENLSAASSAQLSRSRQVGALSQVPAPPPGCASFFVVAVRRREPMYINPATHGIYPHNADAMLLAELWNVPTINGLATFNPPDWAFADPLAPDYEARVATYARKHGLKHLCRLDMRQVQPWTFEAPNS